MSKKFPTQDYKRFKRLGTRWRRPVGRHSKLKIRKGGSGMMPRIGCRTFGETRGMAKMTNDKGSSLVASHVVHSLKELESTPKGHYVIIASSVGKKKTAELAEKAKQMGLSVINSRKVRDAKRQQKRIQYAKKIKPEKQQEKETDVPKVRQSDEVKTNA